MMDNVQYIMKLLMDNMQQMQYNEKEIQLHSHESIDDQEVNQGILSPFHFHKQGEIYIFIYLFRKLLS